MSGRPEQERHETPEELAAFLAAHLDETVDDDLRRRLEPAVVFSAELAWSYARDQASL